MRFVRFLEDGIPRYGWVLEGLIGPVEGTPLGDYRRLEPNLPLESATLLSPVLPGKIIGVAQNFFRLEPGEDQTPPDVPVIYMKPTTAVIGPGESIVMPPQVRQLVHEAHLAVVIGKKGRWIGVDQALEHVLGYTIANDVTAVDLTRRDIQWSRGKGFDTFCPLGPFIETELNITDLLITCHVNSELRQMASTHEMSFTIPRLIAFISSVMTLNPGDIILSGTPGGVGQIVPGDIVDVAVEGIGQLRNQVTAETRG